MKIRSILILAISLFVSFSFSIGMSFAEDAFFINEDGDVGIGTEDPLEKLHIENGDIAFVYPSNPENERILRFGRTGIGSSTGYKFTWRNDDLSQRIGQLILDRNGNTYLRGGKVGIGTSSPSYGLHVEETDSNIAIFGNNTQSSTYNYGVYGKATGSGTHNVGVKGRSLGTGISNYGVIGKAEGEGETNYGIYASAANGDDNYAGYFGGYVYGTGTASFAKVVDRTPFYEGDALSEIAMVSGKNGEIDHSTLPDFAYLEHEVPIFEESELVEISSDEAFETVLVETDRFVKTINDDGETKTSKVQIGIRTDTKGYKVEDGKIVAVTEEIPIYETETTETIQLRSDVYLDEKTGKVYQKTGGGEVFEKDGKIYQQNHAGTEIEEQRDIGAMVSILTVAIQQLDQKNEDLEAENMELKDRLAKIESIIAKMDTGEN